MIESIIWFFASPLLKWLGLYGLIAACALTFFFMAPPWLASLRQMALQIAIGAGFMAVASIYFFESGQNHMAQRIAARDADAERRVTRHLHDVDACMGTWDQTTGRCLK